MKWDLNPSTLSAGLLSVVRFCGLVEPSCCTKPNFHGLNQPEFLASYVLAALAGRVLTLKIQCASRCST
jgi:hypothetical protein